MRVRQFHFVGSQNSSGLQKRRRMTNHGPCSFAVLRGSANQSWQLKWGKQARLVSASTAIFLPTAFHSRPTKTPSRENRTRHHQRVRLSKDCRHAGRIHHFPHCGPNLCARHWTFCCCDED